MSNVDIHSASDLAATSGVTATLLSTPEFSVRYIQLTSALIPVFVEANATGQFCSHEARVNSSYSHASLLEIQA